MQDRAPTPSRRGGSTAATPPRMLGRPTPTVAVPGPRTSHLLHPGTHGSSEALAIKTVNRFRPRFPLARTAAGA